MLNLLPTANPQLEQPASLSSARNNFSAPAKMAENNPLPLELKSAIPKVGMRLADDKNHKKTTIARKQRDVQVVRALCTRRRKL
ncbi:hypothetical protein LA080_000310 [Diaporthe eres]|nr:hypothetical protein LA080_000310 [Diaporthe eres]